MLSEMKRVLDCREGDILADDVINKNGIILVSKDTILNNYILARLNTFDTKYISIYKIDDISNEVNISPAMSYQKNIKLIKILLNELATGKNINYQTVTSLSKSIYDSLRDSTNIIKYILTIRGADQYTYTHCINTAIYSMLLGQWLNFNEHELLHIIQTGLLHDIGKALISTDILNKQGKLTDQEYEIMKQHTVLGFDMLEKVEELPEEVKQAVLCHHERLDGTGYPNSAASKEINQYTRIVSIADVYDAMTSERVYKKRVTPFDAFDMFLTIGTGSFDRAYINLFVKRMVNFFVESEVLLNNGQKGKIVFVPPYDLLYPIVLIEDTYVDLAKRTDLKIIEFI